MSQTMLLLLLPVALILGASGAFFVLRSRGRQDETNRDQIGAWVGEHLRNANEQFLQLATERLGHEQTKGQAAFSQNAQQIGNSLAQMSEAVEKYAKLVKEFESDRTEKYGNLQAQLGNVVTAVSALQSTTHHLTSILASEKRRGQWGEKVAEDILRMSGFLEGVHYLKNKAQDTSLARPDFVFLLPNGSKVSMDVKFPLNNYLALVNSESPEARAQFQAEFMKDVRNRIKEVTKKDYISPDEQTLDYMLLFIPNEQVFGFIQEMAPGIADDAMKQKVILCSPFTLYAFVAIIRQASDIFRFEKRANNILTLIQSFQRDFEIFKERFESLGGLIEKSQIKYQEITGASYRNLDNKVAKIDAYRKGEDFLPQVSEESVGVLPPSQS